MQPLLLVTAALITNCVVSVQASSKYKKTRQAKSKVKFAKYDPKQNYDCRPSNTNSTSIHYSITCKQHGSLGKLTENDTNFNREIPSLSKTDFPKLSPIPKPRQKSKLPKTKSIIPDRKEMPKSHDRSGQISENDTSLIKEDSETSTLFEDLFSKLSLVPEIKQEGNGKSPSIKESIINDYEKRSNVHDYSEQHLDNNINIFEENSKIILIPDNDHYSSEKFTLAEKDIFRLEKDIYDLRNNFETIYLKFEDAKSLYDTYTKIIIKLNGMFEEAGLYYRLDGLDASKSISLEKFEKFSSLCLERTKQKKIVIGSHFAMRLCKSEELTKLKALTEKVVECKIDRDVKQLQELYYDRLKSHTLFENYYQRLERYMESKDEEISRMEKCWTKVFSSALNRMESNRPKIHAVERINY